MARACGHSPYTRCTECAVGSYTFYPIPPVTYPVTTTNFPPATPHRCPVCEGRGKVAEDFYDDEPLVPGYDKRQCRSCWGTGVIWR